MWNAIIPSKTAGNIIPCIQAIWRAHPGYPHGWIIVVDDGVGSVAHHRLPGVRFVPGAKPFVYARNVNIGVGHAHPQAHLIILGDDVIVETSRAFDKMVAAFKATQHVGLVSASIRGVVGNPNQLVKPPLRNAVEQRPRGETFAFICVGIPRPAWNKVGKLDERFTHYGCEDVDWQIRLGRVGLEKGVHRGVVVEHGRLPSSFRTRKDISALHAHNKRLLNQKWGARVR